VVRCRDGDGGAHLGHAALDVELGRKRHAGTEQHADVQTTAGMADQVNRPLVVLKRPDHGREHALRSSRQRRRRQRGDHVDVHAEAAARESAEQILPDVREVLEVSQIGESEETRNEIDVMHHRRAASTSSHERRARAGFASRAAARRHVRIGKLG